ncbi:MAG: ABC transporter ATP-binding protein [Rhodospirillales bacterium]
MPVLVARGLSKSFGGVDALAGVDLAVDAGEMVALIGPNGAGKSTCFNILGGQLAADAGAVEILGQPALGLPPRAIWRLGVGRTFQVTATFASMTVVENVQTALLSERRQILSLRPRTGRRQLDRAYALLEQVGIAEQADRLASILSYGDLKRVELAMALANQPKLLLMDEPTAGMAPQERQALMQLVADIVAAERIGVLFTEHDMDVVFAHAHCVLVLNRGRLVASGPPAQVRADAQVQEIYLGPPVAGTETGAAR